jgi:CHAT domain-containing protein/tetratricopeptide (TPR) repeat protein
MGRSALALAVLVVQAVLLPAVIDAQPEDRLGKARRLQQEAAASFRAGRAQEGLPRAREALALREAVHGPDHPEVAESANTLADLLRDTGDVPAAVALYERALSIRERKLGASHALTATSLNNLAYATYLAGDLAKARALAERSLAIRERNAKAPGDIAFSLNTLALILNAQGHRPEARAAYERALALREQASGPDHPLTANILHDFGVLLRDTGDRARARQYLQRAVTIRESGPSQRALAATLMTLASVESADGNLAGARAALERALGIRETILGPDHVGTAEAVSQLAEVVRDMGDFAAARSLYERALAIRERALGPRHPASAASLAAVGYLTYVMGDPVAARPLVERALAIREQVLGLDHAAVSTSLSDLGSILAVLDQHKEARAAFERALAIRQRAYGADHLQTSLLLHQLGDLHREAGDRVLARQFLERALTIRDAAGAQMPLATTLNALGFLAFDEGDLVTARGLLDRALAIRERILGPQHPTTATSLNDLARVHLAAGRYTEAQAGFERALRIRESVFGPEHALVGQTLRGLGDVLRSAGDFKGARPPLERALAIFEKRFGTDHAATAATLHLLAVVAQHQGDLPGARALYERALAIREKVFGPTHSYVAITLRALSYLSRVEGNRAQARAYAERAVRVREQALGPDSPALAWDLNTLAQILRRDNDHAQARALFERSLLLARKGGLDEVEWRAASGLGFIAEANGRWLDAVTMHREAVRVLERLAGQFDEGGRAQFLQGENRTSVYDALARALLRLHQSDQSRGHDREAFAVLEAKKGRVVAEALGASRPRMADPQARRQAEDVQVRQARVLAIERELREEQEKAAASQNAQRIRELTTRLAETKSEYLTQVQAFLARYPKYKALFVDQQTVDPKMLAKFADRLPPGTLVVQYFSAPDALYIFVVAAGGKFQVKTHPVKQDDLYDLVRKYREHLRAAETQRLPWADDGSRLYLREVAPLKDVGTRLTDHLLTPIARELTEYQEIVFIPNDLLLYLPLHALTRRVERRERFLAETHVVSYLTQLELLDLLAPAKPQPNAPLLALANPDGSLPGASGEVRALRTVRSALTMLEGDRATKEEFLRLAAGFPQLHLATHGVLDPRSPERSYLLVAGPDEASQRLSIAEIAGLSLQRGLAILSACDTAVGEQVPGAALITLAAAFSQAGAEAIVASLWKVNDESTRDFMVAFHREIGSGQAVALQRAQRAVLANPATAHPFYWAAFILIGAR